MDAYEWKVFNWFTSAVKTLSDAKQLCLKHFNTDNVDILNENTVKEIYKKENKKRS